MHQQKRFRRMSCMRRGVTRPTSYVLYGVIVITAMTSCVKVERSTQLAGPKEPVYYMIVSGRPFHEIEKALRARPEVVRNFEWLGLTLLDYAAAEGREDVVELLLSMGADANGRTDISSPLMNAISSGNPDVVRMLLDHGASPFLPQQPFGFTPYEIGMEHGNEEIVELLRQAKSRRATGVDSRERKSRTLDDVLKKVVKPPARRCREDAGRAAPE